MEMRTLQRPISASRPRLRAGAVVLLTAWSLVACITRGPQISPAAETVNAHPENGLRVIRVDGTQMDIETPRISGDTLFGIVRGGSDGDSSVAIPLVEVRSVAVKRIDGTRTAILVAAIGVSALATISVLIFAYRFVSAVSV
jgi:hypothetical protein